MAAGDNDSLHTVVNCLFFPTEPWKCDTILIFQRITAILAFVGCSFVLFTIWLFRRYTATPQRMILFVSVGGIGNAVASMVGFSPSESFCKLIAWVTAFFDWVMLLWVIAVAVQLYLAVFRTIKSGRFEWLYHYLIWPLALLMSILPFFSNKYGNSGVWCWIVDDVGWRLGMWYVPIFVVVMVLFILYISVIIKLRSMIAAWERTYTPEVEANKKFLKQEVRPLAFFPFIYLVFYIIPTINRIQNAVKPGHPIYVLVLLATISATAIAAMNSLAYGLDKDTRAKLTRDQIKNAWYSHFAPKVKIGEYNMEVPPDIPVPEPTASRDAEQKGADNPVFCPDAASGTVADETEQTQSKSIDSDTEKVETEKGVDV